MNDRFRNQVRSSVKKHKPPIANARFDTSDVVQDVMIQVWREIENQNMDDLFVHPAHIDSMAKGHTAKNYRFHNAEKRTFRKETPLDREPGESSPDPAHLAEDNEFIISIFAQIKKLDRFEQKVIYKRFFQNASFAQIGEELGQGQQWVRRVYIRSIQKIKMGLGT